MDKLQTLIALAQGLEPIHVPPAVSPHEQKQQGGRDQDEAPPFMGLQHRQLHRITRQQQHQVIGEEYPGDAKRNIDADNQQAWIVWE
jgi:hypothetical protein